MTLLRRRHFWHTPAFAYGVLALLLIVVALLASSVFNRYTIERDMAARRAATESELEALNERKTVLEEKVEYLRDDRGVEAEIRKHFDVARAGEQVVVLLDGEPEAAESLTETPDEPENKSIWSWLIPW